MVNVSAYRISVYLLLAVTVHPAGVHSNLGNATDILIWCMGWLIVVKRFERMKIMPDIAIMTVSNCGILPEEGREMGITVVPMPIQIDGKT